ncbi:MAG TPA: diaminopimelate epimerase [Gemmatimonadales bacterium]|nr:diaminopimelate epimerase [Gemmatimonadales bacterium]
MDGAAAPADGLVRPHLSGLPVYKMTGSGNDFVMVDGRHTSLADWSEEDIRAVCARGTGVGADGLVLVSPGTAANAVRMIYFNADGSRAAMCGNAALCATQLAARLGLASAQGMILETDAGSYQSRCQTPGERAELRLAPVPAPGPVPGLATADGEQRAAFGIVGVPHLVVLVDDVGRLDVMGRGHALRFDPALGAAGANVNFVSPGGATSEWRMRTYERGVEAETLACGTGAVAVAYSLAEWGLGTLPLTVRTRSERCLVVDGRRQADGTYGDVWLTGEARLVLRGVIN